MTLEEARRFLAAHQPLPATPSPRETTLFLHALHTLHGRGDTRDIPLVFGSLGDWEDLPAFDAMQSFLRRFPAEAVLPYLISGLERGPEHLAVWCADTARYFPHRALVPDLVALLRAPKAYTRLVAAAALERIGGRAAKRAAAAALADEADEDVRDILEAMTGLHAPGS